MVIILLNAVVIVMCSLYTQYASEQFQILDSIKFGHRIVVNNLLIDKGVVLSWRHHFHKGVYSAGCITMAS